MREAKRVEREEEGGRRGRAKERQAALRKVPYNNVAGATSWIDILPKLTPNSLQSSILPYTKSHDNNAGKPNE